MFHRLHRQVDARQMPDFTRPQTGGVDDELGVNRAGIGGDIPAAIAGVAWSR